MPEFRALLAGGGEMGERIRTHDWTASPLGPPSAWPQSLRSSLSICLNSPFPTAIYWGPDFHLLYNDAWSPIPGNRHPEALGRPGREVWSDIWPVVGPQFEGVMASSVGFNTHDQLLKMTRFGRMEEGYWDYSLTPIAGETGEVAGILNQGQEVTGRLFAQRRDRLLVAMSDRIRPMTDTSEMMATALAMIAGELGAGRAGFGEIDESGTILMVEHGWTNGAMSPLKGSLRIGAFGKALHEDLEAGRSFAIDDTRDDPRVAGVAESYDAIGVRSGIAVPIMAHGRYIALLFVHCDGPRGWTPHHMTLLTEVAGRLWQELARTRAEAASRASEARYRLIFEQAQDLIFTADLDQRLTAINPAAAVALGIGVEEAIGQRIADYVSPQDYLRTSAMLAEKLMGGKTTRYEVDVLPHDGRRLRWEVNSTLTLDADGVPTGLHAIARDVTVRHAQDESQRRLIDELNHRVKNTLAIVQGLAWQSFRGGNDGAAAQEAFQARLARLAAAHDLLTREKWESVTLASLVADATRAESERVTIDGPPMALAPKAAVSLSLALHELTTNATRYGSLSVPAGRVTILWWPANGHLHLEWRETGGPPAAPPAQRGFGLKMIERALANDLGGTVTVDFPVEGLVCTIDAGEPDAERGPAIAPVDTMPMPGPI